jgi:hypothetical protein
MICEIIVHLKNYNDLVLEVLCFVFNVVFAKSKR